MSSLRRTSAFPALALLASLAAAQGLPRPSLPGHAHNDYLHPRPLHDALAAGYCSVEIDVHLVEGRLLVAHAASEVDPKRTIEKLYLDPLMELLHAEDEACVDGHLLLLIDFKTAAAPTLEALQESVQRYDLEWTRFFSGEVHLGSVTVVVSGDRPRTELASRKDRGMAVDGRLADLDLDSPADLIPLISDNWQRHFGWTGEGPFSGEERTRLRQIVDQAHTQGRLIRFWAVPHRETVWSELLKAGVDLISVDDLDAFADFYATGSSLSAPAPRPLPDTSCNGP